VDGCIVSNEFFDALAFHRLRFDGSAWHEIFVDLDGDRLIEKDGPLSNPTLIDIPNFDIIPFEKNQEIEVRPEVDSLFDDWGRRLSRGYVLTFDYGHPRATLYSATRPKGTWLAYYQHQAVQDPFVRIGAQDLTAHVDFTQLADAGAAAGFAPQLFCTQGLFLTHVGQERIDAALRDSTGPQRQSIAGAVKQLLHPDAMGEAFWTLVQSKDIDLPAGFAAIPNRLKRLNY
jgi:SAM-dependent MidA family methyltransferase